MNKILVPKIIVSKTAFDEQAPWELCDANLNFVELACRYGLFELDEFLPDCEMMYHLYIYHNQIINGGHAQFVVNCGWHNRRNNLIETGLKKIGATGQSVLFNTIRTAFDADPQLREDVLEWFGTGNPPEKWPGVSVAQKIDDDYFALEKAADPVELGSKLLRSHKELVVVPDSRWDDEVKEIANLNPYLLERIEDRKRLKDEQKAIYERKLRACVKLSEMIGSSIDASRGAVYDIKIKGRKVRAVTHVTDTDDRVFYVELDGKAIITSYPDGEVLAELDLSKLSI